MLSQTYEYLHEVNLWSILLRMSLATLCGGIIGLERGSKRRAAGFRTYMLVCLGATLVMITNQYITICFGPSDPARLGAQVISGIGFLGAGTIIVTRQNQVIGLTTAAGLWASACIGLAIGIGFYEGAVAACIFIMLIITGLHRIDRRVVNKSRSIELYVELAEGGKLSEVINYAHAQGIQVYHVEFTHPKYEEYKQLAILVSMHLPRRAFHREIVAAFATVNGVEFVEEL